MKERYLIVISSCDNKGYSCTEFYKSQSKTDDIIDICKDDYRKEHNDYSDYLGRGDITYIDLQEIETYNWIKDVSLIKAKRDEELRQLEAEELKEYKRLKEKYGDKV